MFFKSDKQIFGPESSLFVSVNWARVCRAIDRTEAQKSISALNLRNGQYMGLKNSNKSKWR